MALIDNRGRQIPFFIEDFTYEHVASAAFDPITTGTDSYGNALDASTVGKFSKKGFLVRPDTDGLFYGITFAAYDRNHKSLTGLTPTPFLGLANTWIECPYVKIYKTVGGSYPASAVYINVAPL
jgi:hypothetical protein